MQNFQQNITRSDMTVQFGPATYQQFGHDNATIQRLTSLDQLNHSLNKGLFTMQVALNDNAIRTENINRNQINMINQSNNLMYGKNGIMTYPYF